ncbi:MAG: fibronectin type III domain-containing protein, partial [Ruminiclostridium sp.]|nr:fibronectin type III domain-containing protein [Ruminiclostridium sp.]
MKNLTKRVIGMLISSAMLLTSPVVYADEVTEFTEFTLPEYTVEAPSADFGVTNDELLLGYFENQLYDIEGGISTFAVAGSSSLTGDNKKIYDELKAGAIEIANGQRTSTVISVDLEWSFSELGIADDAYFTADDYTALNAKIDALDLKGEMIHLLLRDCPYEFYWYNSTESTPISVGDNSSINQVDRVVKYNYKVSFPVSADYSGGSAYTVNTAKTSAATAAATKAKSIVSAAVGKSDYEKLVYYKEQICSLVEYNNTAAGKNYDISVSGISPWQLIYVFDGNSSTNVVCEGYAKAFQYLCDLTDFRGDVACYCATGMMTTTSGSSTSGGGHMWNIARINGKSYLVDVTNCDGNSIGNPDKLFLKGMVADASNYRLYTISFTTAGGSNCKIKYEYDTATTSEGVRLTETEDNLGRTIMAISSEDYVEEEIETIDISTLTVSAIPDQTYKGSAITPSLTVKDGSTTLTNGTHYTVSYSNNTNAGTATVTITGKGNYTGTKSVTFKIVAKSISGATLSAIANQTYTGVVIKPSVTVKDGSVSLTNNTHYTITYSNNVNVGTATVTITGKGNYTGTKSTTFGITAKSISGATLSAIANQTYTGSAIKPSVTVKDGSTTLTNGTHYTVTYSNNTNIGTATVTVTGKGNYTGTKSTAFSIVGKSISSAGVSSISNQVYTGSPITPAVTVTLNSVQLVKDKDYTIAYTNNTSVGTATVNITGIGTYSGTRSITFRITAKNVSGLTVTPISSMVYNGSALSPAVTVKDGSKTLTKGTDYTVSYSANINAGTGNAVITGKGNYTGTRTVNFTITPASISNATIAAIPNIAYTGTAQKPLLTVKYGSTTLTVGTHYTATYSNNTNVGTATVTITGIGNYGGTKTANFKITAKSISSATISTIADQTYTGSTIKPSVTVKDGSTTLTNGTHYTATYSNNTNVGTATVTITGIGEYSGTRTSTFRIVAKSISGVTISAIADQTHTGSAITPAITVKDGSATLTSGTHYTVAYSNNTNVGTATVTITGKGNYTGTKTVTFKIVAKTITTPAITVTPGNGQVTVKWNAVSGATMYAAFYRVNGTSAWTQKTTTATSYTFTGLKNGTKYDFLVIAYNGSAWSTWTNSNVVNATPVGSGSSAFGTPAITVTPGNGQATVKWN